MGSTAGTGSTLQNVTDDQKRWLVFGIALNRVLVTQIRLFVEQEIQKEYGNLQTSHSIHTQSTAGRLKNWPTFLKYENINGNDAYPRLPGGRYNYSLFDCRVTSHVDFAKLYVENHMAKFNAFDEHCDASAVLTLLAKVPVFSHAVQSAAGVVKQARNAWAHCVFRHWDLLNFQLCFADMEQLVKALGLPSADEKDLLKELKDWEIKGAILCMNVTIDPDLVKTVQQDVNALKNDVDKLAFEEELNRENLKRALQNAVTDLEELQKRVALVEHEQEVIKEEQSSLCEKVKSTQGQISELKSEQQDVQQHVHYLKECLDTRATQGQISELKSEQEDAKQRVNDLGEYLDTRVSTLEQEQEIIKQDHSSLCDKVSATQGRLSALQSGQEDVQRRVTCLEDQQNRSKAQISYEIANCDAEIRFFAGRHDKDTRQWLLEDFDKWFNNPGDSRAYVLLGDPGVGKSVMAGVLAQRSKKAGSLGAAYFCRHNVRTRNDPRYLLGTVACQLCECNSEYTSIMGGEDGVRNLLGNYKLGVQELFTKLLEEPLGKCNLSQQRKLVVIDALDETQYESREDFLDLIMNRFPILPKWLVFFITSRPENTVQLRLKKYNPCVRICAGNVEHHNFFQQHDQDIKLFLRKNVDVSGLPFSVDDVANKCKGSFLYASYIATDLNETMQSGELFQLDELFPGNFDTYLLKNFKRVFDKVGSGLFKKLFGCAIVAPAPLPVSFISYVLRKENSNIDKKLVVDALSLFMVLRKTFTFLHNLIPTWLTDEDKAEELFINRNIEAKYLKDIIIEILVSFIHEASQDVSHIKTDLLDYVLRFGIRFLCLGKDSLETVFTCLTSFKYIQNRIRSRRIEIYSLIEDFKLAADCPVLGDGKKDVLLDLRSALEGNIFVLLECPHLLCCCLQNASKAVQKSIVIPCHASSSRLQWNSWPLPVAKRTSGMAVSPDGKLLAARVTILRDYVVFCDSFSMEVVLGPVKLPSFTSHLEFSPDGTFLFYGRLDKWFSLEEECVKEFPQFSEKNDDYEWGSFTPDKQCIVVKDSFYHYYKSTGTCCQLCMLNYLCLWAAEEIGQGQERETICVCFPERLSVCCEGEDEDSPVPAMRSLLNVLKSTEHYEWCRLLEKLQLNSFDLRLPKCGYCSSRENRDTPNVASVHDFLINHYSMIFKYQVWDVQTGKSVLDEAFSSGIQMSPFTYLCHLGGALELCGVLFSGIDKALSICNIALLNTVYHHLIFFNKYRQNCHWEDFKLFEKYEKPRRLRSLEYREPLDRSDLERLEREQLEDHGQHEHLEWLERQWRKRHGHRLERHEGLEQFEWLEDERCERHKWREHIERLEREWLEQLERCGQRKQHAYERFKRLVQFVHVVWYQLKSREKFQFLREVFHFGTNILTNAPLELQTLFDPKESGGFISMLPCVSPDGKWIAMRPYDIEKVVHLYRGENREHQHTDVDSRNAVHVINEVEHCAFTNDSVFFLYLTMQNALHALSLRTGTILTSVSGVRPLSLITEKQTGYLFRFHDEDNIILVKDFPSGFLKFIPVLEQPIQATFVPADTILVLRSDSVLTVIKAEAEGYAFTKVFLTGPVGEYEKVTKCQFSQDGKLIVTHQGTNILLYYTSPGSTYHPVYETEDKSYAVPVYETEDKSYAVNFAFSAESSFLLFWILQSNNFRYLHVWDVQEQVISASIDSPGLFSGDCCCCFAPGNKELIICHDFHIEVWDHTSPPCRLLKRVGIDVPYTEVDAFSYCTVSQENDLLACCIADKILLYPLSKAADQSIFQLPRAHLGKIEFCQFLKGNHYLISYGVDGMVVLWDLSECKAIAYAKIAQGRETIVSMAVSPEEDKAVCLTSFWRLNIIKLCGLKCTTLSKLPLPKAMTSSKATATIQRPACSANTDISVDLDVAELIEEMDFMLDSDVSEESDEQSDELDELQD